MLRNLDSRFPCSLPGLVLLGAALLAGCAAEPPPRPAYQPPAHSLNTPVHPVEAPQPAVETPRARLGDVDDDTQMGSKAGVRGLTFDEFHQCMELKASILQMGAQLDAAARGLKDQKSRIDAEDRAMEDARGKINPGEEGEVFAFNSRVKKQRARQRSYNEQVDVYNGEVAKSKTASQSFTVDCADRPFRVSDIERLPPALQAVAKDGTEHFDLPVYYTDDPAPTAAPKRELDLGY